MHDCEGHVKAAAWGRGRWPFTSVCTLFQAAASWPSPHARRVSPVVLADAPQPEDAHDWSRFRKWQVIVVNRFQTTHWSLVAAAREQSQPSREALEQLCRTYRPPVLAYLRRSGLADGDAEDLTQMFFVHFLEHAWYADADPQRGRFRTLLLTALRRFVINQHHHEHALKRHARLAEGSAVDLIADESESPETAFTRTWLATVISRAMHHMQEEWVQDGKGERFEQLAPLLEHAGPQELHALAAATGLRSNTLSVQVHRMRRRLRELVRHELLQTVGSREALEQELAELRDLSQPPA